MWKMECLQDIDEALEVIKIAKEWVEIMRRRVAFMVGPCESMVEAMNNKPSIQGQLARCGISKFPFEMP